VKTRTILALGALALTSACGIFGGGDKKPKTPVLGERIPILSSETGAEIDPSVAAIPVVLPPAVVNESWTQTGGNAAKSMGHPALGAALAHAWTVSIGTGSNKKQRLASSPVVADGRVYTIDSDAEVRAFNAQTGATIWSTKLTSSTGKNANSLFGGGVSVDGDRVFATNGVGDVAALNATTGAILWRKRPGGPLRGAPSIANGNIYVISQDNQIFALRASDGNSEWNEAGTLELAGVFGAAAPAIAQGTVVAGFSSGELNAYRYENGRVVWQDALSRTSISTAVASLSDIDASPVIDGGVVYAVGQGGRMVALEIITGQRRWEVNISGGATPWVAGDWLFVVTDDARLLCIARATGRVRWATQLPRWDNEKKKSGLISWTGPLLAGDRLIVASSDGRLGNVMPATGALSTVTSIGEGINLPPIVANNTLYVLDDKGRLSAYR
jgi:outer membrane protein assembly factor BamB